MPKVKTTRGIRYPKKREERDAIRAGEATSDDVTGWVRVKRGKSHTLPPDMVPDFDERGAIKREN